MAKVRHYRGNSLPGSPQVGQVHYLPVGADEYVAYVVGNDNVPRLPAVLAHVHDIAEVTGLPAALSDRYTKTESDARYFSLSNTGSPVSAVPDVDLNAINTSGVFAATNASNRPIAENGMVWTAAVGTSFFQMYGSYNSNDAFFYGRKTTGTTHTRYRVASREWIGEQAFASQSWVTSQGYITSSALSPYALKANAFPLTITNQGVDQLYTGNLDSYTFTGATVVGEAATGTKPFSAGTTTGLFSFIYQGNAGGRFAVGRNEDEFAWQGYQNSAGGFKTWQRGASRDWVSNNTRSSSWVPTWAQVTGKPTTFTPEAHTHTSHTAGTGLSGDVYNGGTARTWSIDFGTGVNQAARGNHNHDGTYAATSHSHTFTSLTSKPTTISGYGITDALSTSRTITINGSSQDLSSNRTWNVGTLTGTGASGYLMIWNSSTSAANSIISQGGGLITVGGNLKVDGYLNVHSGTSNFYGDVSLQGYVSVSGDMSYGSTSRLSGFPNIENALLKGRRTATVTLTSASSNTTVDSTTVDCVIANYSVANARIQLTGSPENGKEVVIQSNNDTANFVIRDTVRNNSAVSFAGGFMVTLRYLGGFWYIAAAWDNSW